jgi:hypothetical protein
MKQGDIDFEKELAEGPLPQKGFSDELRRKIEARIEEQKPKPFRPWLQWTGAVSLLAVAAVTGLSLGFNPWGNQEEQVSEAGMLDNSDMAAAAVQVPIRSGILIGLRSDDPDTAYRTLYIAPEQEKLREIAEGRGILVPYKQEFWKVEPLVYQENDDRYLYLTSYPAEQKAALPAAGVAKSPPDGSLLPNEKIEHSEKLRFASNQFLSVEESEKISSPVRTAVRKDAVWVTQIPLLSGAGKAGFSAAVSFRKHFSLGEVLGSTVQQSAPKAEFTGRKFDPSTVEWTLKRRQGNWILQTAERADGGTGGGYSLRDLEVHPPEWLVNHDGLNFSWNEIRSVQPRAVDALTSPESDLVVVLTDRQILVYPSQNNHIREQPALTIDLRPHESLVMAQWATDHYVQEWSDKVRKYLLQ